MFNLNDLPKIGVYFLKGLPPHRGHLSAILNAATSCQKLYVVLSHHKSMEEDLCKEAGIKPIPIALRKQWLSQEVLDMPHIKVVVLDESDLPQYPLGWKAWTDRMKETIGEEINEFFVGEQEYAEELPKYFPNAHVTIFDPQRTYFHISATMIRQNPLKHWDYILGSARPYFAKKVLIAGTESCGKTTLTKSLAKIYHTSWSEEVGRYYAERWLGGDENYFTDEDFTRIAHQQVEQDYQALRGANRVCFFDTDATATQYFSELYMGHSNPVVEQYIDGSKYDVVFLLKPDVTWVDDGMRLNGEQEKRVALHEKLKNKYLQHGFNVIEVGGSYNDRLMFILDYLKTNLV